MQDGALQHTKDYPVLSHPKYACTAAKLELAAYGIV